MKPTKMKELRILKIILWVYIILCILIAGLNYGYARRASVEMATFITKFWHFYENWIKTLFIIICSYLTLRIIGKSNINTMRRRNLIGFIIAAFVVHITAPLISGNSELYFFTMPLPWTTTPLQLLDTNSSFYISRLPVWGLAGITSTLIFYICFYVIVILGTFLFGRRWQCSTLCLFNGFASEVFEPAIPLIGNKKLVKKRTIKVLFVIRWIALAISIFFTLWWILHLLGIPLAGDIKLISKVENYIYLSTELLVAISFWIAFIGRGYCYYCPLGTVLGLLSKLSGQQIITSNTKCIQCNQCNLSCPMSIDIKINAEKGEAVKDLRCVGCGHCVDVCPARTLSYSTRCLDFIHKKNRVQKEDSFTVDTIHNKLNLK